MKYSSRVSAVVAVLFALVLGALLVVGVVLPAEYSLDPLGTGSRLGLLGLADDYEAAVVKTQQPHGTDRRQFSLAPFESVEFSYRMSRGEVLIYSWQATGELVFNLHSSPALPPAGEASDYAESFSAGRASREYGTYTAPFAGQHGWFWENRTQQTVVLELAVAGFIAQGKHSALGVMDTLEVEAVFESTPEP